ncbi:MULTISPECIES: N-acetylmuramoyl-L-alanine amidase [unclassified Blastococcus]
MRRGGVGVVLLTLSLAGCGGSPGAGAASSAPPPVTASASLVPIPSGTDRPEAPPSPSLVPPAPVPAPVVVLDPGHNGGNAAAPGVVGAPVPDGAGGTKPCNTTGTSTDAGYPEHAFTWDVALRTRDLLTAGGVEVVLTRADDTGVGPCVDARGALPGRVGAAAFVGIHGDGAAAGARGFHVITSSRDPAGPEVAARTDALAVALRDALSPVVPPADYIGAGGLDDRSDLAALNLAATPAVYVECGNMRNATDAALMSDAAGRHAIAERLAAGVLTFLGR